MELAPLGSHWSPMTLIQVGSALGIGYQTFTEQVRRQSSSCQVYLSFQLQHFQAPFLEFSVFKHANFRASATVARNL